MFVVEVCQVIRNSFSVIQGPGAAGFVIIINRNVIKKEAEKILKYKDLTIEIQLMWNVKTNVIPVIIGAIGTISKSFS